MINNITIEICVGCIQDVEKLEKYDVDRIELNSCLELDGITPSLSTLIQARKQSSKKIMCMCRCRGGNFCYSEPEYETMFADAKLMLENGADGIVFGFLNEDSSLNVEKSKAMIELVHSYNKQAIFHKAADVSNDIYETVRILDELGIDRILTSGQQPSSKIVEGCIKINELREKFPRIEFLPGGGVRINNIVDVLNTAKTNQVHMTSKKQYEGQYVGLDEEQLIELLTQIKNKD